jgi:CDP-paratose 2-epimerase
MSERILIPGGAGFVGSSLALGLKSAYPAMHVLCLDNLRRRGSEMNVGRLRALGIQFIHGDIRNATDLEVDTIGKPDVVIDCSAEPAVLAGLTSPQYVIQTNLIGTMNVLELCRRSNAKLLFLSSSRVYSIPALRKITLEEGATRFSVAPDNHEPNMSAAGIREEFSTLRFRSLYGATKLASEMLIEEYRHAFGVSAIVNRCGLLTGPWQMARIDQGVFGLWVAAHYFRTKLAYIGFGGSGKQVRDLLHVEDLLKLVKYQLEHFDDLNGEVFNVAGGSSNSLSLLEATDLCRVITGNTIDIEKIEQERPADIPLLIMDSGKVTERTGWKPERTPKDTLEDIYEWIRRNEDVLRAILESH